MPWAAWGSPSMRPSSIDLRRNSVASRASNVPTSIRCAPGSRDSRLLLVMITAQFPPPGSSGSTCSSARTSSSTTSRRHSARKLRYRLARSSTSAGITAGGAPSARRKRPSTRDAVSSLSQRSPLCRSMKSWPSGKSEAAWCAARSATAVLPVPAAPVMTMMGVGPSDTFVSTASIPASSCSRPVKSATGAGSCRGTIGIDRPSPTPAAGRSRTGLATRSSARIVSSSSRSSGPGSMPISSMKRRRASW